MSAGREESEPVQRPAAYLVEFEDDHRMLTECLLRLPRLAREPASEERGDG